MYRTRIPFSSPLPRKRSPKGALLIAILVGIVIAAFDPCGYADLLVSNQDGDNSTRQYDERPGEFLGVFTPAGSGGLSRPDGLLFGPDGNLYVADIGTSSILRYDGITGDPLPSAGNDGATFVPANSGGLRIQGSGGAWLIFGPDGNLYVLSGGISAPSSSSSVLRFSGTTGEFI